MKQIATEDGNVIKTDEGNWVVGVGYWNRSPHQLTLTIALDPEMTTKIGINHYALRDSILTTIQGILQSKQGSMDSEGAQG
jgi:hypothetical protein